MRKSKTTKQGNSKKSAVHNARPVMTHAKNGTLIITKELLAQINYLHHQSKVEWSGVLYYTVEEGDPSDPESLVLKAHALFPMDEGSSAATSFEYDESIVDVYENYPEAVSWKTGLIHTHHSMAAYFSTTDMEELDESVDSHEDFYLSLIVNYACDPVAKIALKGERTINSGVFTKNWFMSEVKEEILYTIDLNIEFEFDDFFVDKFQDIRDAKKKASAYTYPNYYGYGYTAKKVKTVPYSILYGKYIRNIIAAKDAQEEEKTQQRQLLRCV